MSRTWTTFAAVAFCAVLPRCDSDIVIGAVGRDEQDAPSGSRAEGSAAAGGGVLRRRLFSVPSGYMPLFEAGQAATFLLFDGEAAVGQVSDVVQRGGSSGSWLGPISAVRAAGGGEASRRGRFILSALGDSWASNVRFDDAPQLQYEIRPYGAGGAGEGIGTDSGAVFSLSLVDVSVLYDAPEDLPEGERRLRSAPPAAEGKAGGRRRLSEPEPDHDDILDVGVRWTPEAAAGGGGAAGMLNLLNLAVDESNAILQNSGVSLRVRVAAAHMIADTTYVEPAVDTYTELFWAMQDQNDGVFDVDTGNRYEEGADVMVLLVDDASYCGVAGQLSASNYGGSDAYAVVARGCATGVFTFLHEIGHLLGAHHDVTTGWFSYSRGHCWLGPGGSCADCGRSVMAYGSCQTAASSSGSPCSGCARQAYFSNPEVYVGGYATGTVDANNNALTVNLTRHVAVGWASSTFPGGIIFSVSPSVVPAGSSSAIRISGWRLSNGDPVVSVTLDGVEAAIVSQTQDSVDVVSSGLNENSGGQYTPVVVSTGSGRVTTLDAIAFTGTSRPTARPSRSPTFVPTTATPTRSPSAAPSARPSTAIPTASPTYKPTASPTHWPTAHPTAPPSFSPTAVPTTPEPTATPTPAPSTASPSLDPGLLVVSWFEADVKLENQTAAVCENASFVDAFRAAVAEAARPEVVGAGNVSIVRCSPYSEAVTRLRRLQGGPSGGDLQVAFRVTVNSRDEAYAVGRASAVRSRLADSVASSAFSAVLTAAAAQRGYLRAGAALVVAADSYRPLGVEMLFTSHAPTASPTGGSSGSSQSGLLGADWVTVGMVGGTSFFILISIAFVAYTILLCVKKKRSKQKSEDTSPTGSGAAVVDKGIVSFQNEVTSPPRSERSSQSREIADVQLAIVDMPRQNRTPKEVRPMQRSRNDNTAVL